MNIQSFEGWIITCPHCGYEEYIHEEDIAFNPKEDREHFVQCKKCEQEFEVYLD